MFSISLIGEQVSSFYQTSGLCSNSNPVDNKRSVLQPQGDFTPIRAHRSERKGALLGRVILGREIDTIPSNARGKDNVSCLIGEILPRSDRSVKVWLSMQHRGLR